MYRFIESIKYHKNKFHNLSIHQERINDTFNHFFSNKPFLLNSLIKKLTIPETEEKYKLRIVYSEEVEEITFEKYIPRPITHLFIKKGGNISYPFKNQNREKINFLCKGLTTEQDIIIVKNKLLTDSSYSNLAFYSETEGWVTPENPLLKGTKRKLLLLNGEIQEKKIRINELENYKKVSLINSMLDLGELVLPIDKIENQYLPYE